MLLAVLMISAKALAYDFEVDGICYNILSETTCKVAYKNFSEGHYEGSVTIPEQVTYNGITRVVTAIGDFAFNGCENLTNIDIPNSVTSIGSYAFQRCINLKSIDIPNSVISIGSSAFYFCEGLTSIDIPNSVTSIDDSAFEGCFSLTSVDIPNSITSIREYTFDFCKSLMSVDIPNSVTSIGECAFMNCYSLTRVAIPNSVTSIGNYAFQGCESLKSVNIPNSVTKIFPYTFVRCSWLRRLVFVDGGEELEVNSQVFEDCSFIEQLYLGRNLTCPESSAPSLYNLTTLADVTIGSLVTDVTAIDWTKNENLKSIHLLSPTPPTSNSFSSSQYENVTVFVPTGSLSAYQADAIWKNFWLLQESEDDISITEEEKNIWKDGLAYRILSKTTCEVIPYYDDNGQRVPYEGDVVIPEHITYEGQTMKVTAIGDDAFAQCTNLRSIELPNTITEIGCRAFRACANLLDIDLPNSVAYIRNDAFAGCFSLTSANIPNSVTSIEGGAFHGCKSLTSISIPNSVSKLGGLAFCACEALTNVNFESPGAITAINRSTFNGCSNLTSINIPNSVTSIGNYAFSSCTSLTGIDIPNSVTSIDTGAFGGCSNLKNLVFEDGKEYLEVHSGAFYGCPIEQLYLGRNLTWQESSSSSRSNLTTLADVTIGSLVADVTAIDWTKNESLLSIKSFAATPPVSGKFTNPQYMNLKVSVPSGSLSSYKEDIVWRNFWNLQDDLPSAASIGEIPAPQSIKAADGRIIVENAQGRIEVYTLSGILMESLPAQGGTTEIHLPQGVYIIKAGGETVKVIL